MSSPGVSSSASSRRQKRMGPAPFASFEDLSDEVRTRLDSPEDKHVSASVVRLPGIREDATPCTPSRIDQECVYTGITLVGAPPSSPTAPVARSSTPPSTTISSLSTPQGSQTSTKMSLQTPSTPRIDISRASSSSHHEDSRDSTPERELFDAHEHGGAKLGLAFKEEGALDLRSSTEELDFQDPHLKTRKDRPQSPCQLDSSSCQRKDSQSSEIGLLSISGRTSRLSSIGSQGSAQSRVSTVSHLSIISGQSGRSPSPHKMLLETSFCGYKSPVSQTQSLGQTETKIDADVLEKVLLARKHDPRHAILAEGITMEVSAKQESIKNEQPSSAKLNRKNLVNSQVTITIDKPAIDQPQPHLPKTFVSPSGVEYIYIPLKGPLPPEDKKSAAVPKRKSGSYSKPKTPAQTNEVSKSKSKSASSSPSVQKSTTSPSLHNNDEPKYIRIKLKPDHMYGDEPLPSPSPPAPSHDVKKPACLDLRESSKKQFQSFTQVVTEPPPVQTKAQTDTPTASPQPTRHKVLKDTSSKTPSPSLSRRSSFTSIFKSRETIASPDSPTVPGFKRKNTIGGILKDASDNIRSRSKSRDRDRSSVSTAPSSTESIDSTKSKQKSVLSIFKPKKSTAKSKTAAERASPEVMANLDGITNVEFKFNTDALTSKKYYETPLSGESIRIPLHSPTHYEDRSILQELKSSSQDSQETVIDTTKRVTVDVESNQPEIVSKRQSSASSENVVFSTELGSNNDVFRTKIPKEKKQAQTSQNDVKQQRDVVINQNGTAQFLADSAKCPLSMDKSATLNEIVQKVSEVTPSTGKITKTESLNLTKAVIESIGDQASAIKDLTEGSKRLRRSLIGSLTNEDRYSSESEKDSELDYLQTKKDATEKTETADIIEPERKGLVLQQDSFDDELPYIPTTLPQERYVALPIVPVKQRGTFEMKTYPIDRPRSTTPINLSTLEDYCEDVVGHINTDNITAAIEKLKISLPKDDAVDRPTKTKSPRKPATNQTWFAFGDKSQKRTSPTQDASPPPLPPKGVQKEWINFEEIPERRKPPRRIQTIPSRGAIEVPESVLQEHVVYSYVNPEDCKCECHEIAREREQHTKQDEVRVQEDEVPLLVDEQEEDKSGHDRIKIELQTFDRRSIISDSSLDLSTSLEHQETSVNLDLSLRTPFTGDLGVSSNRSSVVSQFQDEPRSPDVTSPNAFPKTS